MDECNLWRELAQYGYGGRLVVHKDAAFACAGDFAAQKNLSAFGIKAIGFEDCLCACRGFKDAAYDGLLRSVADDVAGGLATEEQGQRIHQDGLARTGLAGEQIQAGAELCDCMVDDGLVFCAQFKKHLQMRIAERKQGEY